jgi:lipopolysaccharide/colanic/teichoic acid biosynthesis glycosyltransferase
MATRYSRQARYDRRWRRTALRRYNSDRVKRSLDIATTVLLVAIIALLIALAIAGKFPLQDIPAD